MSSGGANGGIKVHHYEFLRCFVEHFSHDLQLYVFCQEETLPELEFLSRAGNHQIHVVGPRGAHDPRDGSGSLPVLRYWPEIPEGLLSLLKVDLLYAGFGSSQLYWPQVPQVSLIVDVLHRTHAKALPAHEVAFRDSWYAEELQKAALVQTNSAYCKSQLVEEFKADPEKIFTIAVAVHGRFNRVEMGKVPSQLSGLDHKYLLYPANYWPHKNHELLFIAFRKLLIETDDELYLVLTGNPGQREDDLKALAKSLEIGDKVIFLGKLELPSYKAVWELAKAAVIPSLYEGFGIPILEAAHFQTPLHASRLEVFEEILGSEAHYFDPLQPLDIHRSLSESLKKPCRPNPAVANGYNLEREARKLIDAFKSLTQAHARSR